MKDYDTPPLTLISEWNGVVLLKGRIMRLQFDDVKLFVDRVFKDKMYGEEPYIKHLNDCVSLLTSVGATNDDLKSAMYAHDLEEDFPDQMRDFTELFGDYVTFFVTRLARKLNQTYTEYINSLIFYDNHLVLILKLVDLCCNREACQCQIGNSLLPRYVHAEAAIKLHFHFKHGVKYSNDTRTMLHDIVRFISDNKGLISHK